MASAKNHSLLDIPISQKHPDINPDKRIGKQIQLHREQLRMSQLNFGKKVRLSQVTVSEIEAGKRSLKAHELRVFATALNVGIEVLI